MEKILSQLARFKDFENLFKVFKYVLDNSVGLGVNLPVLTRFYLEHLLNKDNYSDKEYRSAYMRLYRFFNALKDYGFVEIKKADSLVWVKATDRAVDLIFYARKIQTQRRSRKTIRTRKRVNEFKFTARVYLEKKHLLDRNDLEYVYSFFEDYLDKTDRMVLVFKSPEGDILVKRYSHRFQRRYLRRVKEKFRKIFDNASKRFQYGVFLTLTMDPKSYDNILEGVKRRSEAWNRFMSFLSKRVGFRPPYVSVLEFQDSGNPHLHVVIFGINRIMDHFELTEYLKGHGFGQIHYEYKIMNKHGNWVWSDPKSKPSLRSGVIEYLEKYLDKAFGITDLSSSDNSTESLDVYKVSLYWVTDARFFTYSRCLYQPVYPPREYGWVFIGSYDVLYAPEWLEPYIENLDPPVMFF